MPPDAVSLLPGEGDAGAALVRDPRVHTIAFTGSGAVGLEIVREAGQVRAGQQHLKRVIAEMGGKNCVIVDSDADLDEVVPALVTSAYLYAGQKCSAAARVLVHEAIHDGLLERLAGAVEVLDVGQAERLGHRRAAGDRARGPGARRPLHGRGRAHGPRRRARRRGPGGRLVRRPRPSSPTCRRTRPCSPRRSSARCWPSSGCATSRTPATASTPRRSRSPAACSPATRTRSTTSSTARPVGNLYVNRSITGAMVGRQPFGGNRLSGTGTKAGGPGYLLQFVEPRVVTENTMRHGLVVVTRARGPRYAGRGPRTKLSPRPLGDTAGVLLAFGPCSGGSTKTSAASRPSTTPASSPSSPSSSAPSSCSTSTRRSGRPPRRPSARSSAARAAARRSPASPRSASSASPRPRPTPTSSSPSSRSTRTRS